MSLKSPFSYIYRKVIYAHAIHCRRHLNYYTQFCLAWKVYKNVKYLPNRSEGVQCYPEFEVFEPFFILHALQNVGKVHSSSRNDVFLSRQTESKFIYVLKFHFILVQLVLRQNCLRFSTVQNLYVYIVKFFTISQATCCVNGALLSMLFRRTGAAGLSACWSPLCLRGLMRSGVFMAQQPPDLAALRTPCNHPRFRHRRHPGQQ